MLKTSRQDALHRRFITGSLLICLIYLMLSGTIASAQTPPGTIAYVQPNDESGDEIHLIQPDGTNDRRIWQSGQADPDHVEWIGSLAWNPDATELAFDSNYQRTCSFFEADVFLINSNGSDLRRVTQAPTCAELTNYPQGTVTVPVRNFSFDASVFFIYFQGAPGIELITLGAGQSGTVTFENVADFGADYLQTAIALGGAGRWLDVGASADVVANNEVTTPVFTISGEAFGEFGAGWPAWLPNGEELAYVLGFSSLYRISTEPEPLELGDYLLQEETELPLFVNHMTFGPTAATANRFLYDGGGDFDVPTGIYRTTAGSNSAGERIVSFEGYDLVYGLAWLPDGSGFVYSVTEEFLGRSNIFVYRFATQQSTRLTEFTDRFTQLLTISPDGERIVFELAEDDEEFGLNFIAYDLWIMDIDGSNQELFIENAHAPAWSPKAPQTPSPPPTFSQRQYLPQIEPR